MWKLNWLMLRSFIGPFFLSFFLLVFILDMQFFWLYLDDLLGKGLDWYVIAELLFYASANVVPMALPLSVLLSSTMTYGNLAENLELTALKASGTSFIRMSRPLIVVMLCIGIFAFYFSNTLWPTANFKMKALLTDIYQAKSSLMITEGRFSTEIDHFGIRAGNKDAKTGELKDVLIFDRTGNVVSGNAVNHSYTNDPRDYHRDIRSERGVIVNSKKSDALLLELINGQITEELDPKRFQDMKFPFWKIDFAKDTFFKDHLLNKIQEKLETRFKLQHVYANGHTFGTMGDFHRDWNDETGRTFLLYVNNGWSIDWGGHTIFDLGDGKYHYHLPRPNSATFFPGIIPHMAEATSRKFGGLRVTIAWKLLLK